MFLHAFRGVKVAGYTLLVLVLSLFSLNSYALSCKDASTGSISEVITLNQAIEVSTANLTAGTVLWRSPVYNSTFKCEDTNGYPSGENAYLYWDPLTQMQSIDPSIEVGVTYNSIDIKPTAGTKTDVGRGTVCNYGWYRNNYGYWVQGCMSPATPQTVKVSYSIYIKATGKSAPSSGKITNTGQYPVFQVDGVLGLNSTPNSNFRAYIAGLGNIRFISCSPQISVSGNSGSTVNFGTIASGRAQAGVTEKQVPFSVVANLTGAGQDCQGKTLVASFSTTYPTSGTDMIMPASDSGFGISISTADAPASFIPLNTSTSLGYVNGSVVQNNFVASLRWLNNSPKIGTFNASANVDVTFK
ncbi:MULTISPECIES: fimbrial protein [unclassified Erwinia]|uniref:fimbrial protein n=1 Tax=unclassified Erwinia TaxID=2622719 RepID=UPI0006F35058|nr:MULTISPECIES: fimbrial protein [unclassified Erwinia]KQN64121.1 fimbrial protein [Erwinia sp. Leaf53]PLV57817.1 fimbrial protein [Erwinia sp. B116]